jgi:hypothetical protein
MDKRVLCVSGAENTSADAGGVWIVTRMEFLVGCRGTWDKSLFVAMGVCCHRCVSVHPRAGNLAAHAEVLVHVRSARNYM